MQVIQTRKFNENTITQTHIILSNEDVKNIQDGKEVKIELWNNTRPLGMTIPLPVQYGEVIVCKE